MKLALIGLFLSAAAFPQEQPEVVIAGEQKSADLSAALKSLKDAEAKKDPDEVKKWSDQTAQIAQKTIDSPQPKEEDEAAEWKKQVDYAKQVSTYADYALYAMALQTADPKKKIELIEALEKRNPKSEYLAQAARQRFIAYQQAGDNAKALAFAEKSLAAGQEDPEMLLVVAYSNLQKKQPPEKVASYTDKIIAITAKPKPEGVSDADWEKQKARLAGTAHYIAGVSYFGANKFAPADRELRQALPLIDNSDMKAETLFDIAMANYKMQKVAEALRYYQQCAAIKSRYQAQAAKNVAVIKSQYRAER